MSTAPDLAARVDDAALDSFYGSFAGGNQASWNAHGRPTGRWAATFIWSARRI